MSEVEATKKLNPKQAQFLANVLGGMKRVDAYKDAYGLEDDDPYVRQHAYQLIATNSYIKAEIDKANEGRVQRARERLYEEAEETLDMYFLVRESGVTDHNIRLRMCMDHLDRIGLKPKDEVEHTGHVVIVNDLAGAGDDD